MLWNATCCCPASTETLEVVADRDCKDERAGNSPLVAPLRNNSYGGGSVVALVRVVQGGLPRSQQHDEVIPSAGTHQPSVGGRCWLLSYGLGRTGRRLSAASGYIQPRALCSRAEGITDYRLQITGHQDGLHAAACLAHVDSNETTCYAIRETTKGKKRGVSYKCPRSRSAREGGLGYSLLVCVILPCGPNQVGSTSGPPLRRPGPCHDASLSPLAGSKTHASGEGCASECVGKRPILEKTKQKNASERVQMQRCRCSRQSCLALLQLRASPKHYLVLTLALWWVVFIPAARPQHQHPLTALTAPAYRR